MKSYLFLDLETSGLDPNLDRIVEVGWMHADYKLRRITGTKHTPVLPVGSAMERIMSTKKVAEMHSGTGLLDELLTGIEANSLPLLAGVESTIISELETINELYQKFKDSLSPLERLDPEITEHVEFRLAGKNVHFDKAFVDRYMPRLSAKLSHRTFDEVSVRSMLEAVGLGVNVVPVTVDNLGRHRAAFDVELSYTTMKFALEQLGKFLSGEINPHDENYAAAFTIENDEFSQVDMAAELDDDLRRLNGEEG